MSTLQVANVWFESTANNRIQYSGSNSYVLIAAGANTATINSTAVSVTGTVNATSHTVGSSFTANSTGVYTTGTVSMGSSFARNKVINGSFDIWQRGTSFASVSGAYNTAYTADRWWLVDDSVGTVNVTRQDISTLGMNSIYCLRAERSAGTNRWVIGTNLETITTKELFGKTIIFSCKARKGSALTSDITVTVATQNQEGKFGAVVDGGNLVITNSSMNTSTFTTFTYSYAIPANSTSSGFKIEFSATQAGATNAYFEIAEVQVEIGSVATPFERRLYGQELMLCQRYYQKTYDIGTALGTGTNTGAISLFYNTTFGAAAAFRFMAEMRAAPTMVGYATNGTINQWSIMGGTTNTVTFGDIGTKGCRYVQVTSGGTVGYEGHYTASAEL